MAERWWTGTIQMRGGRDGIDILFQPADGGCTWAFDPMYGPRRDWLASLEGKRVRITVTELEADET